MRFLLGALVLSLSLNAAEPKVELAGPEFAWTLHRAASADTSKNSFLSPYSVNSCLGMVSQGAKGDTLEEMRKALRHQLPAEEQHAAFGAASHEMVGKVRASGQELDVANAICLVQGGVNRDYLTNIRRDYDAEVFGGDEGAANAWVSGKTKGMIPQLLRKLPPLTVCVLLNAVYFKGTWRIPFDPDLTRDADFKLADGGIATVKMMHKSGRLGMVNGEHFRRLVLPYGEDGATTMEVLLPRDGETLDAAERATSSSDFARLLAASPRFTKVELYLPRFRLQESYVLNGALASMGIRRAFGEDGVDFSLISGPPGFLFINTVAHKAVVEIDEKGTTAVAATAAVMITKSISVEEPPCIFRADRPFLFVIRNGGTILFIGRVSTPPPDKSSK